jgi:hypothetical protein
MMHERGSSQLTPGGNSDVQLYSSTNVYNIVQKAIDIVAVEMTIPEKPGHRSESFQQFSNGQ